jgi:hypothetical protein
VIAMMYSFYYTDAWFAGGGYGLVARAAKYLDVPVCAMLLYIRVGSH